MPGWLLTSQLQSLMRFLPPYEQLSRAQQGHKIANLMHLGPLLPSPDSYALQVGWCFSDLIVGVDGSLRTYGTVTVTASSHQARLQS